MTFLSRWNKSILSEKKETTMITKTVNKIFMGALVLIAVSTLVGCGTTPQDRAISGAGVGAAAGAVTGAIVGGSPAMGAALGAAAGSMVGASTNAEDVNLGTPAWKK